MLSTRREFAAVTAGAVARSLRLGRSGATTDSLRASRIKAVAFDAFALFDPRPVFAQADDLFPGAGLSDEWRTRQFEYCWLRIASRHYADFWQVTEDALIFAAHKKRLPLDAEIRSTLMSGYLALKPWPDVVPAVETMKRAGLRLAILSNFTPTMLAANVAAAQLTGRFDRLLSTDRGRTYKPDPRAYQLGVDGLAVARDELLFVAFAGWDAAGAKLFGYPTFWVNRQQLPAEELGALPDATGDSLMDLLPFLS
jgi:2-haloacid dehalogenase